MKKKLTLFVLALFLFNISCVLRAEAAKSEEETIAFEDENIQGLEELGEEGELQAPAAPAPVISANPKIQKPAAPAPKFVQAVEEAEESAEESGEDVKEAVEEKIDEVMQVQPRKAVTAVPAAVKVPVKQEVKIPTEVKPDAVENVPALPQEKTVPSLPSAKAAVVPAQLPAEAVPQVPHMPSDLKTEKITAPPVPQDGIYRFVDYFPEVEARIFNKKNNEFLAPGIPSGDKIVFKGYESFGSVSISPITLQGQIEKAITFDLIPGTMHQLLFKDFHIGQQLLLHYILIQKFPTQTPQFVYLKVLIGEKEIKRIQISSNEPWKKEELDLGIVSFLNKGVSVRFEVSSDNAKGLRLNLIPQLKN